MIVPREEPTDARLVELRAVLAAFAGLVQRWRLGDADVDSLLYAPPGVWAGLCEVGCRPPLRDCEERMRGCLAIDILLPRLLGCGGDAGAWLRTPQAALGGFTPLATAARHPGALRAIRDALESQLIAESSAL